MPTLEDKRTIVTGGGKGLGRAYALAMAKEGATVVVNDIDVMAAEQTVADIAAQGGKAVLNSDNVTDFTAAKRIIDQCIDTFGGIDVLVNNAGVGWVKQIFESTEEDFNQIIGINLQGTFNCGRHAIDRMIKAKSGSIINVSSGAQAGVKGRSFYSASKGGVSAFTYTWAIELAPYGIRVNAIAPYARTGRVVGTFTENAGNLGALPDPETCAPIVVYLASDNSSWITGQTIRLSGDTLGLIAHPKGVHPMIRPDGWTVDTIKQAFERQLKHHLEPVGAQANIYQFDQGVGE